MTKQQVNLYQIDRKRARFTLNFRQSMQFLGVFGGILFLISAVDAIKFFTTKHELSVLEKQQVEFDSKLKLVEGKIPPKETRDEVLKSIQTLEVEQREKQKTLDSLLELQRTKMVGFSRYFLALSEEAVPGVWLTRMELESDNNYVMLEGKSLKPEYVPRLMEGLSKEAVFSGKTFQVFKLSVDKPTGHISFSMETSATKQVSK